MLTSNFVTDLFDMFTDSPDEYKGDLATNILKYKKILISLRFYCGIVF